MIRPRSRMVWVFTLAILIVAGAMGLRACFGPDTTIIFTWEKNPDLPLKKFAAGRVGILQPFYARSYLVVAYRYLMDKPLSPQEQVEAVDLWDRRLNGGPMTTFDPEESGPAPTGNFLDTPQPDTFADDDASVKVWLQARSEYLQGPTPELKREDKRWERLRWFQNIQKGAFRTALRTLESRAKQWGRRDPRLKAWIQAQDQVFSTTEAHPHIPPALGGNADPLLAQDRVYQIASAKFYAQRYDEAIKDFEAIALDGESPWSKVASYMTARSWYRKAQAFESMEGDHHKEALQAYGLAIAAAEKVPDHPRSHFLATSLRWEAKQAKARGESEDPEDFDEAARFLAKAASANEHPLERTRELAALLVTPSSTPDFGVDLGDFTILMDRHIENEDRWDGYLHGGFGGKPEKPRSIPETLLQDDLTDWVFHVRETGPKVSVYAHSRWKERKSMPWLLLALANAGPSSEGASELMEAAASVPTTSPGFPMAAFHRARLLMAMKRSEEARPILNALTELGEETISPSAYNLARAMRLPLARSREELVDDLLRKVVGVESPLGENTEEYGAVGSDLSLVTAQSVSVDHLDAKVFFKAYGAQPTLLQSDGATLLNLAIPTSVLMEVARSPKTPPYLRREWTRCAWVRAVVLEDLETAVRLTPEVQAVEPELVDPLNEFLAAPQADRQNMAAWVLMHHPGLRWYVSQSLSARTYQPTKPGGDYNWMHGYRLKDRHPFRDSFWPRLQDLKDQHWTGFWFGGSNPFAYEESLQRAFGDTRPEAPAFLSESERAQLAKEVNHLNTLDDGPTWLCKRTLAWANAQPKDPKVPEALHFAVRATRIGGATELSKKCFRLLHERYAKTEWAKKTPFYF
jgi:tetratricopeptide (TPR) repeat protein